MYRLLNQSCLTTLINPQITSNSFQNPVDAKFQNPVDKDSEIRLTALQNSVDNDTAFKVKKSRNSYDSSVIGIVSTQPAIVIEGGRIVAMGGWKGQNNTMKPAVALAGRVPVKVTDENGPIQKGDLLTTSSKAGYGMRFTLLDERNAGSLEELKKISYENSARRGAVLGKALEPCLKAECAILAFVSLQ